jgi:hypothetical protein
MTKLPNRLERLATYALDGIAFGCGHEGSEGDSSVEPTELHCSVLTKVLIVAKERVDPIWSAVVVLEFAFGPHASLIDCHGRELPPVFANRAKNAAERDASWEEDRIAQPFDGFDRLLPADAIFNDQTVSQRRQPEDACLRARDP